MNARQKAKKYKRMYEELLNRPVNFTVEQRKIDTVIFERRYRYPGPLFAIQENSNYFREVIVKDITHSLTESLDKYADCYIEYCPHANEYRICGKIEVVNRKG